MTRTLLLRPATAQEIDQTRRINAASWSGGLTVDQYVGREKVLVSQSLTRNGGLSSWVLVDTAEPAPQTVLSSVESIKKLALVAVPGEDPDRVEEVTAHGIGSVFTPPDQRGHGYASIMLRQMGDTLQRGSEDGLSVLWSDIGKKFYAKLGWLPHRSSHLYVTVQPAESGETDVRYLRAGDVAALCVRDITALREQLAQPSLKTRIALLPDYQTFEWHWAREDYLAKYLRGCTDRKPEIKGAITADGKRWMVWKRDFSKGSSQIDVLRLVNLSTGGSEEEEERELAKLFHAACREAAAWELSKVCLWNPSPVQVKAAARHAGAEVVVTDREEDSICSLRMNSAGSSAAEVEWIASEKFAWC